MKCRFAVLAKGTLLTASRRQHCPTLSVLVCNLLVHAIESLFIDVYLALLIMCFLLAMGNRPQGMHRHLEGRARADKTKGSNKTFMTAVVVFAGITVYMTVGMSLV